MSVKYISRKKMKDGDIVKEDMRLIQVRIPTNTARIYRTLLQNKDMTITKHLELLIMNWIADEKMKLKNKDSDREENW